MIECQKKVNESKVQHAKFWNRTETIDSWQTNRTDTPLLLFQRSCVLHCHGYAFQHLREKTLCVHVCYHSIRQKKLFLCFWLIMHWRHQCLNTTSYNSGVETNCSSMLKMFFWTYVLFFVRFYSRYPACVQIRHGLGWTTPNLMTNYTKCIVGTNVPRTSCSFILYWL